MKKRKRLMLVVAMVGALVACSSEEQEDVIKQNKQPATNYEEIQNIIAPNNQLGFEMVKEVEENEQGNVFVSPTSLFTALSMVYNGAAGETKEEIAEALQVKGITVENLNRANAHLREKLENESTGVQLNIANSIWLKKGYHFQKDFAANNKKYFNAKLDEIDVEDKNTAKKVNDWVKSATKDKIEEMVEDPLHPNIVAFLLNAIYFKGDWMYEFDEKMTEEKPFHLKNGKTTTTSFMQMQRELSYMETDAFQAIKLPYGDGEMSMQIFLPNEASDLASFKTALTNDNWAVWNESFQPQEGTISLPKFQMEYEVKLNDFLIELGMESAFNEDANFTNLVEEAKSLAISEVKQKTFIDVNEKGTEAAAVTVVEMRETSVFIEGPFVMEVNRPFFIAITDEETGAILFIGTIENPTID